MISTEPAATARTCAPENPLPAPIAPQATPGQIASPKRAITAAQRQQAYRQRSKRAVTQAIGDEAHASRVTLLVLLGRDLAILGDETASSMHLAARSSARRVLHTLVTRYGIDLEGQDRT